MSKWDAVIAGLSTGAKSALRATGTDRQGARVPGTARVLGELQDSGLIGPGNGLTRSGSIVREKLVNQDLERTFG